MVGALQAFGPGSARAQSLDPSPGQGEPLDGRRNAPATSAGIPGSEDSFARSDATARLTWNGFDLGRIPLDAESIHNELRRSFAGTDQEMMRELVERKRQTQEVARQSKAGEPTGADGARSTSRREFSLVETIPAPATGAAGLRSGGKGKGGHGDPEDLFDVAVDLSNSFNASGARFTT